MRPTTFLVVLAVAAAISAIACFAASHCQVPSKQLTWECGGLCDDFVPCVAFNSTAECADCVKDGDDKCQYQCLPQSYYKNSSENFQYLIPFSKAQRDSKPIVTKYENFGNANASTFPAADGLSSIGKADIHPNCTQAYVSHFIIKLCIWGLMCNSLFFCVFGRAFTAGSVYNAVLVNFVINVSFAEDLLAKATQLERVSFNGFNLQSIQSALPQMLPKNITTLKLRNDGITSFEVDIQAAFPDLVYLQVCCKLDSGVGLGC